MRTVARRRVIGTFVGAVWGLLTLLIALHIRENTVPDEMAHYLIVSLIAAMVIYSTVLLKIQDMAYFSTVVFLSITINHIGDIPLIHNCAEDVLGSHGIELANSIISIFLVSTSIYWNVRQPDEAALQYSSRKTWG